ncbi:MAG TPA: class I SAM-dependent methyltransferase [Xanthobacteraceae bacterium]|nr:class I SAM-dependent methyltransferase [Xanthobacteraceae bacterium]
MDAKDQALLELGRELQARDYRFITVTPASHHRVYRRPNCAASLLERVFGWSRPFQRADLPSNIVALLEQAEELESDGDLLRAKVRFSSLGRQLFVHSSFPTESSDAVFFGPDTYRFARALRHSIAGMQASASFTVIDIGCGSGAGGLHAASLLQRGVPPDVILSDINPRALRYSRINAWLNGISNVRTVLSDLFERINEGGDLIVSNPPYLIDQSARLYRHGGGALGSDLSLRIVEDSIDRLYPGGRLFLYTGSPIINGADTFFETVRPRLEARGCQYTYEEVDPDVFGEELDSAPYDRADRIAAVALTVDV